METKVPDDFQKGSNLAWIYFPKATPDALPLC